MPFTTGGTPVVPVAGETPATPIKGEMPGGPVAPPGWRRSQSTPPSRQCRSGSHRRKSFKIQAKTSYQDKNDVKRVVFGYTGKKGCHILSIFWHTFCVRKSTDCAIEFGLKMLFKMILFAFRSIKGDLEFPSAMDALVRVLWA